VPAVRGAVRALVRSLAREVAPSSIRVNGLLVSPGADVQTLSTFIDSPAATMLTGAVLEEPAPVSTF
jgi:NAD(P)-dependent dehydrogenase (short-subunit alcohol dehydrogenase family)